MTVLLTVAWINVINGPVLKHYSRSYQSNLRGDYRPRSINQIERSYLYRSFSRCRLDRTATLLRYYMYRQNQFCWYCLHFVTFAPNISRSFFTKIVSTSDTKARRFVRQVGAKWSAQQLQSIWSFLIRWRVLERDRLEASSKRTEFPRRRTWLNGYFQPASM